MDEGQELLQEFLIESNENLARLDQEFVELEKRPEDEQLLSSIFRTIHTIKGTCGFLGFTVLEAVTHRAENLLSQLRDREKRLTAELTTLLLETVDVVKGILSRIEETSSEGIDEYGELRAKLEAAVSGEQDPAAAAPPQESSAGEPREHAEGAEAATEPWPSPPEAALPEPAALDERSGQASEADGAAASDGGQRGRRSVADSTIRVDVDLLDKLMTLAGELVLSRNQIVQYAAGREDSTLTATSQRLNLITTELQAAVMKTRMQPIGVVWNKFPRVVRDLARSLGKEVNLQMEGAETELDKTIIEAIKDPLTHVVRNSCDHGIERPAERRAKGKPAAGTLSLRAYHEGGQVNIEISDDGAGIHPQKLRDKAVKTGLLTAEQSERLSDKELLNLIFMPGLSTAEAVTKVSGRGVGMDVVKTNIERTGGSIDLHSRLGQGTTIKIKIPLTLAIIPALMVSCSGERYAIPQINLLELVGLSADHSKTAIEWVHGAPVYRLRGKLLPLVYLDRILGVPKKLGAAAQDMFNIVVLQAEDHSFGLVVDGVHDTQEIVVKPLATLLKGLSCYAGATIMGDGKVALILDVFGMAHLGGAVGEVSHHAQSRQEVETQGSESRQLLLLFRSGSAERLAVPLSVVARLEEFRPEQVEQAHGTSVVQYRDRILPLVPLAEQLGLGTSSVAAEPGRPIQVIVFADGDRQVGLIVDQILDIVEDSIRAATPSERPGIVGSGVVVGRVTDFLDLEHILPSVDQQLLGRDGTFKHVSTRVMLAEASSFSRGLLRNYLELNGYAVVEAASAGEAIEKLGREKIDVLLSSLDLPDLQPAELLHRIRREPQLAGLPVVGLTAEPLAARPEAAAEPGFDDYQLKSDRPGTIRSIERLAAAVAERAAAVEQRS